MFNVESGIIDRWLARWAVALGRGVASFEVASAAIVAFGLVAGSLAFSRFERHRLTATLLAGLAGSIAVFALLGYLTGIDALYDSRQSFQYRYRTSCRAPTAEVREIFEQLRDEHQREPIASNAVRCPHP